MSVKVVKRLHNDIRQLKAARKKRHQAARELRKDERSLKTDKKELKQDRNEYQRDRKHLSNDRTSIAELRAEKQKQLQPLQDQAQLLQQAYDASIDPLTGQGDPAIQLQLAAVNQQQAELRAKYDPRIDAKHAKIGSLKQEVAKDRKEIQHDKNVVKHDHKELKHDKKLLEHRKDQAHDARHKALQHLRPAEYKMGLKQTNKVRKELGLEPVKHVIRPPGAQVTPAMKKLAAAGRAAAMSMGGYNSQGLCATGVSKAIRNALGISVWGNGNQIDNNLPKGKFKQIHIPLEKALKIPGLVLTWEHTSTSLGRIYGHTAITTGDGHTSCSDFIETNTLAGAASRSGLKIFVPTV